MRISLDITKSVEENASMYFDIAKKNKQKLKKAKTAHKRTLENLKELEKKFEEKKKNREKIKIHRKKAWFEKFRWMYTSEKLLFLAGRDATTNEIIIKKHVNNNDLVFHSDVTGSPFGVLKIENKAPSPISLQECANFIGCYSKAWKQNSTTTDVFYIKPEQVTKKAPSGEYLTKGSFMIYGKKTFLEANLKLSIGKMQDGKVLAGPQTTVKKHCKEHVEIGQGKEKTSTIAKKIMKKINADDLDEINRLIPANSKLLKLKRKTGKIETEKSRK